MTEPRWVKTGDIEEWLRNTFGIFWVSGDDGWEKRIEVVDPDPVSLSQFLHFELNKFILFFLSHQLFIQSSRTGQAVRW